MRLTRKSLGIPPVPEVNPIVPPAPVVVQQNNDEILAHVEYLLETKTAKLQGGLEDLKNSKPTKQAYPDYSFTIERNEMGQISKIIAKALPK